MLRTEAVVTVLGLGLLGLSVVGMKVGRCLTKVPSEIGDDVTRETL